MERKYVYENELTEEDLPSGAKREDAAETERLDPDVDSQKGRLSSRAPAYAKDVLEDQTVQGRRRVRRSVIDVEVVAAREVPVVAGRKIDARRRKAPESVDRLQ